MLEPPEAGPYPPDSIWRFPPPPVSRLWLVAAILGGVLGLTGFGAASTYLALNSERDIPGFIDDELVLETATRECRLMTSTVEGLSADGRPEDWIDTLGDQDTAVRNMVTRIRSLGSTLRESDQPLDAWLSDWEKLLSGREEYLGQRRRSGDTTFRVPRSPNGDPINVRMDMAAEDVCPVPEVLLNPDLAGTRPI